MTASLPWEASHLEIEDFVILDSHVTSEMDAQRLQKAPKLNLDGHRDLAEEDEEQSAWAEGLPRRSCSIPLAHTVTPRWCVAGAAKLKECLEKSRAEASKGPSQVKDRHTLNIQHAIPSRSPMYYFERRSGISGGRHITYLPVLSSLSGWSFSVIR